MRSGVRTAMRLLSVMAIIAVMVLAAASPSYGAGTISTSTWVNVNIPDNNTIYVNQNDYTSGAPANATISKVVLSYQIVHTYVGDLQVQFTCEYPAGVWHDYTLWNRAGGTQDNITVTSLELHAWDGGPPNNTWYLKARDLASGDTGYIDYFDLTVYYVIPPDLRVVSVDATNGTYRPGNTFNVSNSVTNDGDAASSYSVKFYASLNTLITTSDTEIGSYSRGAIAGGATQTYSSPVTLPTSLSPNTYYIGMIVTCSGDSNLANNSGYDATPITVVPNPIITASAGSGGSISPSGNVTVIYGNNQAFTITPNAGYQILNVIVDGTGVGAVTPYTFTNVTANHTISASFAALPGSLQFSASSYSVSEGGASATITVTRTGGSGGAVGVSYATSNGTATAGSDYTATSGTLSWANGDTANKTFTVQIINDVNDESDETVNLALSSPTNGASLGSPSTATLTIADNDEAGDLQFSSATYSDSEGAGTATIAVTRTGGSSGAVGVSYATSDGSANAGSDYTAASGTLSWANGDTANKTFTVSIINDANVESDETVNLTLSSATGGATVGSPNPAVLTIIDDDPVSGDTDADGLPDSWEMDNFGDLDENGSGNPDSDGLNNTGEYNWNTEPDYWDTDDDGWSDGDEVNAGYSPTDPASHPTTPPGGHHHGCSAGTGSADGPAGLLVPLLALGAALTAMRMRPKASRG